MSCEYISRFLTFFSSFLSDERISLKTPFRSSCNPLISQNSINDQNSISSERYLKTKLLAMDVIIVIISNFRIWTMNIFFWKISRNNHIYKITESLVSSTEWNLEVISGLVQNCLLLAAIFFLFSFLRDS